MAAHPGVSAAAQGATNRWSARRGPALLVRTVAYLAPIVASILFVHAAGQVVPAPLSSLWLYLAWWFGLSVAATVVLIAIDRVTRRLLPLAALLHLSLVFPDEAPSRFKVAFRAGDVDRLESRLAAKHAAASADTPSEAAARLLELVAALNIHDPLTRGHCDRVRAYSVMIGEELGLTREELDLLNWAALLHDVGKLEVPTEILSKNGKPTDLEWRALRQHPLFGENLVEPMRAWLGTWTSAVGFHHERWDGRGYPRGLAGEEIPLPGRIVAVADVFDVITSMRSYKKASQATEGRAEIAACAGTQFDPAVVRAFLNVSLGRMRLVMGPLSWLAHAPLLGRLPLTPALGTAAGVIGVAATSAAAGFIGGPATAAPAVSRPLPALHARPHHDAPAPARHPAAAHPVRRTTAPAAPAHVAAPVPPSPPAPPASPPSAPAGTPPAPAPPAAPAAPSVPDPVAPAPASDAPAFTPGPEVVLREDDPPLVTGWAQDISGVARFAVGGTAPDLLAAGPSLAADGTLRLTPAPDANGAATFTVTAASADGVTSTRRLRVSVLPVNDPPRFVAGGDVTVPEDTGAVTLPWAQAIEPGPANEVLQHVTFSLATDRADLFVPAGQPTIDASGWLSFTPAPFATGTATVTVTAHDDGGTANGGVDRTTSTFAIDLLPRNHPPAVSSVGSVVSDEDAGPQSTQWATSIDAGAPGEGGQTVTLSIATDHPELFAAAPAISQGGRLTYTAAADVFGTAYATVTARDDGGTANGGADTSTVRFPITIRPVDDAPSFVAGGNQTALENAGPQSVAWAGSISPGPANEASQNVWFTVSSTNPSLFAFGGEPAVAADGTLTYTPAFAATGSATVTVTAHDDGGTANGGVDASPPVTFTLTVDPVNQAPSFTAGADQTVNEDAGPQSTAWATAITPGPNEPTQNVTFTATAANPALFTTQPAVDPTGTLTYTTAPNANGTTTITITAHDDGGTANGGTDTSTPATLTLTITPVNDAPGFTAGADQTLNEDAGPQSTAWATAITPGPNEPTQNVTFTATAANPALFTTQPAVDPTGTLTYTTAPNANGTTTITITAHDDGGTANGGTDTSTPATLTLTITPVNDAPTIAAIAPQTVNEDDGAQAVALTTFSPGPADELSQTLSVNASVDHPEYFDAAGQPTVDASGTLVFTPATGAFGTATVTLTVSDDGGTANGGVDTTTTSFTITIVPLPPNAAADAYSTTVLSLLSVDAAHGVLANDGDVNSTTLTATPQTTTSGILGGTFTLNADGSFTYQAGAFAGQDVFTYTITDGNGQTATGTVTFDVALLPPSGGTFYLQSTGLSPEVWDLSTVVPTVVSPVPDLDADGHPGLTIAGGDGKVTITDPKKQQAWTYETGASTLGLHGPMTLNLTAASNNFDTGKAETLWLYVYDCPGGASTLSTTGCTALAQNTVLVPKWNLTAAYATHSVVVSMNADLAAGRQLRIRLLVGGTSMWIPLVGPYQSTLDYTN